MPFIPWSLLQDEHVLFLNPWYKKISNNIGIDQFKIWDGGIIWRDVKRMAEGATMEGMKSKDYFLIFFFQFFFSLLFYLFLFFFLSPAFVYEVGVTEYSFHFMTLWGVHSQPSTSIPTWMPLNDVRLFRLFFFYTLFCHECAYRLAFPSCSVSLNPCYLHYIFLSPYGGQCVYIMRLRIL